MKIAMITVTYNDAYKFDQWVDFYNEYKDALAYHVIVDNHSEAEYLQKVQEQFSDSVIIARDTNGGSTAAYNDGIRYIIESTDADAIMLLGNDLKISAQSIRLLGDVLDSDKSLGMVAPVLLNADSTIVADFGCEISETLTMVPYCEGMELSQLPERIHYCSTVTGGANLAKVQFYKSVGMQDEKLFMYSDEVDIGLRNRKAGYRMACVAEAVCWHQHVNPNNSEYRRPYASYLITRNKMYIAQKNGLTKSRYRVFFSFAAKGMKYLIGGVIKGKKDVVEMGEYTLAGLLHGMRNDMRSNRYTNY